MPIITALQKQFHLCGLKSLLMSQLLLVNKFKVTNADSSKQFTSSKSRPVEIPNDSNKHRIASYPNPLFIFCAVQTMG